MSVQLGRWNFDGRPAEPAYARQARQLLRGYSPDGVHEFATRELHILYFAFCTTKESRLELQPAVLPSSEVLTWDGRLDNRNDLIRDLQDGLSAASTDLDIVASAYARW